MPGVEAHEFRVRRRFTEARAARLERDNGITLPADYRGFLIHIGDGVAGPHRGIFRFGWIEVFGANDPCIRLKRGLFGILSNPFPFTEPWNDLSGQPNPGDAEMSHEEPQLAAFERRYWMLIDGGLPICHVGDGRRIWLVVTGPEAGYLWRDDRDTLGGFYPMVQGESKRVTFGEWYEAWLKSAVKKLGQLT